MKYFIKKVLDRYKNGQENLTSESIRNRLSVEIEAVLMQEYNIKQKED
jgi:hypothetical protein|tara:strand:+ start:142 stop:285 length:144 start_codon:yes stop_codon:yes gene_type:complete